MSLDLSFILFIQVNKAFQKRWCTLRGNLLFYAEKKGDKEPLGVIILEGCTVELAEEETEHYAFKVIQMNGEVYRFEFWPDTTS